MTTNGDDDASVINRAIGARVEWCIKHSGDRRRTQTELGLLLGITQPAVSKKILGRRPFAPDELYRVAEWLDRPLTDLFPVAADLHAMPPLAPTPPRSRQRTGSVASGNSVTSQRARSGDSARYLSSPVTALARRSRTVAIQSPLVALAS